MDTSTARLNLRSGATLFARRAALALALKVLWAILNYLGVLFLARWLTGQDYGQYAFVMSLIALLAVIGQLGTRTVVIRFIGQYKADGRADLSRGLIAYSERAVLAVSLAIAAAVAAAAFVANAAGWIASPWPVALGMLILPAFALAETYGGVARAFQRIVLSLAPRDILWRAAIIPIGLAVTTYFATARQLPVLLLASAVALSAFVLAQRQATWRAIPADVRGSPAAFDTQAWREVAWPVLLAGAATALLRTLDVIVLGFLLPAETVGWYFAASRTAALVGFVLASTNIVIGPEISHLYFAGRRRELDLVLKVGAVIVFLPAAAALAICVVAGDRILALFGPDFVAMRGELVVLAAGQAVNAAAGNVGVVMNMTGHHRRATEILITTSLAFAAITMVLAMAFGTMGAAAGAATGLATWNIRLWLASRRLVGLDPSIVGLFAAPRPGSAE